MDPETQGAIFNPGNLASFTREAVSLLEVDLSFSRQFRECQARWRSMLAMLYDESRLTDELFMKHAYIVLVSESILEQDLGIELSGDVPRYLRDFLECFRWISGINGIFDARLDGLIFNGEFPGDIFNEVYPALVPLSTQRGTGEYYTPPSLCRLMVESVYEPGMRVLDPACGSGSFLLEIVRFVLESPIPSGKKKAAIERIHGYDKNVLALFMSHVNLKITLAIHGIKDAFPVLELHDSLFLDQEMDRRVIERKFDVLIGNPPWVVLGSVEKGKYKQRLKALAESLGIYVGGKNTSNLETSILFMFSLRPLLEPGGVIFFILPNSIITGSQHAKARIFKGFSSISAWQFTRQPFRVHSTCLKAIVGEVHETPDHEIPFVTVEASTDDGGEWTFRLAGTEVYTPVEVVKDKDGILGVSRFIPRKARESLLPKGHTPYQSLFYKGAQIFPRTMFFVDIEEESTSRGKSVAGRAPGRPGENGGHDGIVVIRPSTRVPPKKLGRWNFLPYKTARVEKRFIFDVYKSTGLVPFKLVEKFQAFIPFEEGRDAEGNLVLLPCENLPPLANNHFQVLERQFRSHMKPGASHETLFDIINYQNCLSNPRQMRPLKVVYNGGGSIVKAAIARGKSIVDYSMFYYPATSENEAYYLLGFLNAPAVTRSVQLIGSTGYHGSLRNIVKHPLDFPLPLHEPGNPLHDEIASVARNCEERVSTLVEEIVADDPFATRIKIQNVIFEDQEISRNLQLLDALVKKVLEMGTKAAVTTKS